MNENEVSEDVGAEIGSRSTEEGKQKWRSSINICSLDEKKNMSLSDL